MFDVTLLLLLLLASAPYACAAPRYVWQASPSPGPPYDTWANAAHDIQAAVDEAADGEEVMVTNGVYATGGRAVGTNVLVNRVAVDKPLALRSVNGPEVTFIQGYQVPGTTNGDGANRCVYLAEGASLSGFTLTNGATRTTYDDPTHREESGGGVRCPSTSAVLTNCVLSGNSASSGGGGAYGGTLNNCTLTGNWAGTGGGAYGGTLYNCTLSSNSAHNGGGASWSTLNNCALTGNSASDGGGGASYGTLNNCTLTGNSACWDGGGAYDATLNNCTLSGNSAGYDGGGAYSSCLNNCTLNNCTLTGNWAGTGGGAYGGNLHNCTVTGNSASYRGGGVAEYLSGDWWGLSHLGTLHNCIVYFNTAPDKPNHSGCTFNYSCTTPLPTSGVGNITNAPLFVDTNAWSDLRLQANSLCIDAGMNLTGLIATDILGLPRPMDGKGDRLARFDIGAYEFNPYRFEPTPHLSGDGFWFTVRGEPGRSVRIERSPDLVHWEYAGEVPIPACGQTLIDPAATTEPRLFYRAMRVP